MDNSILIAGIFSLSSPHFLGKIIQETARKTKSRLLIVLVSPLFNTADGVSHTESWQYVQTLLTFVYVQATAVAQELDNILLNVDVVLRGHDEPIPSDWAHGMETLFCVQNDSLQIQLPESIASLPTVHLQSGVELESTVTRLPLAEAKYPPFFPVVALGGTFDHLHAGHKILLSMSAWIAGRKIIVGVTDDALLVNKSDRDVLEALDQRIARVRSFLSLVRPNIEYEIVPIDDVYGPTGWDPDVQALVVSKETLSGAEAIAKHRARHDLPALQPFIIDVISATDTNLDDKDASLLKKTKISSTFIRAWIAQKQNKDV